MQQNARATTSHARILSHHRLVDFSDKEIALNPLPQRRPLRLGILGFDRLAKNLLRRLAESADLVVTVLADPTPAPTIAHLMRFDTVTGRFPGSVSADEAGIRIGGREVRLVAAKSFEEVDWVGLDVDVVVDCKTSQLRHLTGANPEPRSIPSAAELAGGAMLEVLLPAFGVERAFVTEVRAYAADDRLADVPAVELRQGRAAAQNVSPRGSDLERVLGRVLPSLAGRISSFAIHVPVDAGAAIDLTCWHERPVTTDALLALMRTAAAGSHAGRIEVEDAPIVSSDVRGVEARAVFDVGATMVLGERVSKTLAWFDEESSRPARLLEILRGL